MASILTFVYLASLLVNTNTLQVHWESNGFANTPTIPLPEKITNNWGPYSPYHSLDNYKVPDRCTVRQVNILERHGARYPTLGAAIRLGSTVSKFQYAVDFLDPKMTFLENYTYSLQVDDLLPFGAAEAFEAGTTFYSRYAHLLSETPEGMPFIRVSDSRRIIDTESNFSAGVYAASSPYIDPTKSLLRLLNERKIPSSRFQPFKMPPPILVSEAEGSNNTLDAGSCPFASRCIPRTQRGEWLNVFAPPITSRLNAGVRFSDPQNSEEIVQLENEDIQSLMEMCMFETLVLNSASGEGSSCVSPFCALFEEDEWEYYEYGTDIDKYYYTGYGNPLGRIQGVGYTSELLLRLISSSSAPFELTIPQTNQNTNLPFPLNRTVYLDFSHDNLMVAVFAALGLFVEDLLPTTRVLKNRDWVVSEMTPFNARMVVERLDCPSFGDGDEGEYVRIMVNDAVQPLDFCQPRGGGSVNRSSYEGKELCLLQDFVESQEYVRSGGGGDWKKCFEDECMSM